MRICSAKKCIGFIEKALESLLEEVLLMAVHVLWKCFKNPSSTDR